MGWNHKTRLQRRRRTLGQKDRVETEEQGWDEKNGVEMNKEGVENRNETIGLKLRDGVDMKEQVGNEKDKVESKGKEHNELI